MSPAFAIAGPWIAVVILAAITIVGVGGAFLLLAMGRLTLDLGWGRSVHELGPIVKRIAAPRELVFEVLNAPYTTRAPRDSGVEVLASGDSFVVAAHYTKVHFYTARTVEVVDFEPPSRVGFTHLTGPVPHAVEQFALEELGDGTQIRYGGEVGIDFFVLGRLAARYWVGPQWERVVGAHLDEVKERAEQRAAARRSRAGG